MRKESAAPKKGTAAPKRVAIHETTLDEILQRTSEWSSRIAQRAYEFFTASGFTHGHDVDDWINAEKELLKTIPLEVEDSKNKFVVKADVSGFNAKDLDVHLNGSHLVIAGKQQSARGKSAKNVKTDGECESRQIYCSLELPAAVVAGKARAELNNNLLELTLPKADEPKQVKASAA